MRTVTKSDYADMKMTFLLKHKDWSLDRYINENESGHYLKLYTCADGHQWYESSRPVYEIKTIEVKGLEIQVTIKLLETKGWSTEDSKSVYCYEQF